VAASATAHVPVPQALVSPTPRSKTRISNSAIVEEVDKFNIDAIWVFIFGANYWRIIKFANFGHAFNEDDSVKDCQR
jgi:hypothetical protein